MRLDCRDHGSHGSRRGHVLEHWAAARAARRATDFSRSTPCDALRARRRPAHVPERSRHAAPENNTVDARYFPGCISRAARRRAVLVLPQWNADAEGHVGLCRLLNRFGITALRLSLPYHDARMPPELTRADYIVSANVGRTRAGVPAGGARCAARHAWLRAQGYESIGILGTSLGSCLSMLTAAHEPLRQGRRRSTTSRRTSPTWCGRASRPRTCARGSMATSISTSCADIWMPICRGRTSIGCAGKKTLLVYARYDLTFPVDLSRMLVDEFRRRDIAHELAVLPCGHYSTGVTPFKWIDGLTLCSFSHELCRTGSRLEGDGPGFRAVHGRRA